MESSLAVPPKVKPINSTSRYTPSKTEHKYSNKNVNINVQNTTHNSQKTEKPKKFFKGWKDKQSGAYLYSGTLFSHKIRSML